MTRITTFDEAREAVRQGTSAEDAARALTATLSEYERLWCLDGDAPTWAGLKFLSDDGYHKAVFTGAELDRVGFPGIRFSDGPRGAVVGNATAFPVAMARGATWDVDLEERIGDAIGSELRAVGANLTGAVCINLLRHPAWGRAQETYGEDPHHVGEFGAALTRGLQRHVMACVKHFACNSMENARFSVDVQVDDVALHEVYLPHFRRVVDEGVASVMSAYNSVNGEWCGQSHQLLTDVLRDEWGFEGFVISDWILGLRDAATSVKAGLDIEMPYRMVRQQHLPTAIERGEVTWADVDRSVVRVIATLLRFDEVLSAPSPSAGILGSPQHRALAREAAGRSVLLLRNEPVEGAAVLPLQASQRVAVFGRLADTVNIGDGGSSDVWDLSCRTVLDGLREAITDVTHDDGSDATRAAAVAGGADVAIVVVGYTYVDEGEYIGETDASLMSLFPQGDEPDVVDRFQAQLEHIAPITKPSRMADRPRMFSRGGDRESLRLLPDDVSVIRAVAAANPRTVVVIQAGSAVITTEWADSVAAITQAWYGGAEAGPGLADVLTGVVNPSARLPFTVPVDEADLPEFDRDATTFTYDRWHGWSRAARHGITPAYPFGFGLSYTTFAVTDVATTLNGPTLVVGGTVHNTGLRDGTDVVQVYAELPDAQAPHRLIGFTRVDVPAGGRASFEVVVPLDHLSTRDSAQRTWQPASGRHRITTARFAGDPDATTVEVDL
ncbi:MAG: glycoside hydrolase family 3 C-terminal domain-containing protein [Actinobacteria bacterium]|nr:glycoside hydrolase family 3 C-terminal domain-containing protein [Actinomycetota bacterium]